MKKIYLILILISLTVYSGRSQVLYKNAYRFDTEPLTGIKSNSITDIVVVDDQTIWVGTGEGLSKTEDGGETWFTYNEDHGIGRGGVSAIALRDSMIWVATAFDTFALEEHNPAGGGLSYSTDLGETWTHIDQPLPTREWTVINNVTYDIAFVDSTIWIASFGGGLMRSSDMGQTWIVDPPDEYNFNPDEYLNHRVFSLLAVGDTLWVGTAEGINVSYNGGQEWQQQFTHQNQDQPISGNFVVALDLQRLPDRDVIWAGTVNAEDPDEFRAISKSENGGVSWETYLDGKFTYNFAFYGDNVYAASDSGLWHSPNVGQNWDVFGQIVDQNGIKKLFTHEFYAAAVTENAALWIGSSDGLAYGENLGTTWHVVRSFVETGKNGEPRVYAYPNPFSPMRHNQYGGDGFIRFQFNTTNATTAKIRIFDFAMDLITTVDGGSWPANSNCSVMWNGRDAENRLLANGVYFYQLDLEGDGKYWGKIIIID